MLAGSRGIFLPRSLVRLQSGAVLKEDSLKPFSAVPGPRPLPILGNLIEMRKNQERLRLHYEESFLQYGEIFKLRVMDKDVVVIKDPNGLEAVLRSEGKYPVRDSFNMQSSVSWLYNNRSKIKPSFGVEEGKVWKELRSAVNKQVMPRNVKSYAPGFNEIIDRFVKHIQSARGNDEIVGDFFFPMKKLLVEISAKFTFDSDLRVMDNPSPEAKEFIDAVNFQMNIFVRMMTELPLFRLYKNKLSRDFTEAVDVTYTVAQREIDKVYTRMSSGEESETPGLLEQWLREGKLSEEEAIASSIAMFIAGVDTTANQAAMLIHAIAKYPDVQEKLYAEVKSVLGESSRPTVQQLSDMPYLKGCILESFRLYSTAPAFVRVLAEDSNLLGYLIPKNTTLMYSLYCAGRDKKLFPNPMKFDPERWKRDERHAFAIQPFGFGPRACYGRRFAELELKLILAQLVYNFKMSTEMEELPLIEQTVLKPSEDVPIKFEDRRLT